MAKTKSKVREVVHEKFSPVVSGELPEMPTGNSKGRLEMTGRYVVVFKNKATDTKAIRTAMNDLAGLKNIPTSSDYQDGAVATEDVADADAVHLERLGVAMVSGADAMQALAASTADADSPILVIVPEYYLYLASDLPAGSMEYLRGYRDAVNQLYDQLAGGKAGGVSGSLADVPTAFQDTTDFTWGLQACKVNTSSRNGQGIKVAVLDTGLDLQHPDFVGRAIVTKGFTNLPVQDVHGHGTHCVGTACGSQRPATGVRRYGVAYGAQIFAGKVFDEEPRPRAPLFAILDGIEWAVANGCRVASLSIGVAMDQKRPEYELPIQRALKAGTIVVAAAGNNANRSGSPGFEPGEQPTEGFVEAPANDDNAMAVAAVDRQLRIASFSGRSSLLTGEGGKVNIAGPGVSVFSSVPVAKGTHASFNGTSMATPHVAGIAALWAQATGESGAALWNRLLQSARPLSLPSVDVGSGLAQAPQ
jgi:subtilisin family serine protease